MNWRPTIPGARRTLGFLMVLAGAVVSAGEGAAQDKVVLRRGGYSGRITVTGTIEDYTGEEIRIRSAQADVVRTYPAAEVVGVETDYVESHDRGLALLTAGDLPQAARELETALKQDARAWVRREILSQLVRCAQRQGEAERAGTRFLALYQSDPTTRHFPLIPLAWDADAGDLGAAAAQAQRWLRSEEEAARLIAASLLLGDASLSESARDALRELSKSVDQRIRALAQFQAWRAELENGPPNDLQIVRWQERIDELPAGLRAGPSFLLGRAYALRRDYELAAATYLWLPVVDDHDFRLAARASVEAGLALARIGQTREARALWQEAASRFSAAPAAADAEKLIRAADAASRGNAAELPAP